MRKSPNVRTLATLGALTIALGVTVYKVRQARRQRMKERPIPNPTHVADKLLDEAGIQNA